MARQLLGVIGVEVSAAGVAEHYGARSGGGVLDGWLVDTDDEAIVERVDGGRAPLPRRAAVDDRPRRDRRHGRRPHSTWSDDADRSPPCRGLGGRGHRRDHRGHRPRRLLVAALDLLEGDVVLVTSKVVSKAEGRVRAGDREEAIRDETVRVVARRGPTIDRGEPSRHGDGRGRGGRVERDARATSCSCPRTRTPRRARSASGCTPRPAATWPSSSPTRPGRAWRIGQTDLAVGVAGLEPLDDLAGQRRLLRQRAGRHRTRGGRRARLARRAGHRQAGGRPVSVVRGLGGAGAARPASTARAPAYSIRPREQDMFALGAREAVIAAVRGERPTASAAPADRRGPRGAGVVRPDGCGRRALGAGGPAGGAVRDQVAAAERVRLVAHAHGWRPHSDTAPGDTVTVSPAPP